jgi:RNA polymerase sigma-70 factor (ECF subfamily)
VTRRGEESHPAALDDQTLVERCRSGDPDAFEPLVARYRERVWRLALGYVRDREEAWDVAQEAFVKAWQALPSFRGQSAFYTWLFRIVVNVATDRVRQRAARGRAFGTDPVPEEEWERAMPDPAAGPGESAERAEERARIRKALDALPQHHRAIIMLSDLEGLSYREIAEVLDIPMGTVMSRLHNARKRLRRVLGPLLGLLVLAVLLPLGAADAQQPGMVRFGAQVLLASDDGSKEPVSMPPDLRQLLPRLRQMLRYRDYTLLDRYSGEQQVGGTQRWTVPGERQLEVTPEAASPVRFRVRLVRGGVAEVNTTIQAAPGSPAVIGGPRHGDGVLIIIVSPRP